MKTEINILFFYSLKEKLKKYTYKLNEIEMLLQIMKKKILNIRLL